jgi:hypothetical protein
MYVLYFDLHLEIDNEEKLRTKLCDKRDDFNFPIENFPFRSSFRDYVNVIQVRSRFRDYLNVIQVR